MALGIICSDSPISLAAIREIGSRGVPVIAVVRRPGSFLAASRHVERAVVRPAGPLAEWLPAFARAQGIDKVMAIGEADLLALADLKAAGCPLAIAAPPPAALRRVLDKQALLALAQECGIAVPQSWQPASARLADVIDGEPAWPLVAKWSDPLAVAEALKAHAIDFEKVRYFSARAEVEAYLARFAALGTYPLLQEYCPGYGLGQMFHAVAGRITLRFQHRRLREWPLSGGVSSLCGAVPLAEHAALREKSERLIAALGWTGPAMVEYRYDPRTGRAVLMEINGRFWGSLPLASAAGVAFAWETYRHAFGTVDGAGEGAGQPVYPPRKARYMAPEFKTLRDVLTGAGTVPEKVRFAARFAADFFDPQLRYYVYSASDPGPFWADLRNQFR